MRKLFLSLTLLCLFFALPSLGSYVLEGCSGDAGRLLPTVGNTTCASNQYYNNETENCTNCSTNQFYNLTNSTCQDCQTNYIWNTTIDNCTYCGDGMFYSSLNQTCMSCATGCSFCEANATNCSACNGSYYLQIDQFLCVQSCPSSGSNQTFGSNNTNLCVFNGSCPNQQYANATTGFCESCDNSCSACYGPTRDQCTACANGYFLSRGTTSCLLMGNVTRWADPTAWPSQQVPMNGSDVTILQNMSILLDINVTVGTLVVEGQLSIETDLPLTIEASRIYVQGGTVLVGNSTNPQTTDVVFIFNGTNSSNLSLNLTSDLADLNFRNNVFINLGNVQLYSEYPNTTAWSSLSSPFTPGNMTISLNDNVRWISANSLPINLSNQTKNTIVVASSSFDWQGSEELVVDSINGTTINLTSNSTKYHHGGAYLTNYNNSMSLCAEVGVRSHAIRMVSANLQSPLIIVNAYQVINYTTSTNSTPVSVDLCGNLTFYGVGFENAGDLNGKYGAINILGTSNASAQAVYPSNIVGCTLWKSSGPGVVFNNSIAINFANNFIYQAQNTSLVIVNTNQLQINENLIVSNQPSANSTYPSVSLYMATVNTSDSTVNITIDGNVVVGEQNISYLIQATGCNTNYFTFSNNVAHSGNVGWLAISGHPVCVAISLFGAYKMNEGIIAYPTSSQLNALQLILSDNRNSLTLNLGSEGSALGIIFINSLLVGLGFQNCDFCYISSDDCSGISGMRLSTITQNGLTFPRTDGKPLYAATSWGVFFQEVYVWNIEFQNFFNQLEDVNDNSTSLNITLNATCSKNSIFVANPYALDLTSIHYLLDSTLEGVGLNSVFQSLTPYPLAASNFTNDTGVGANYSALYNYQISDLDGSFFGYFNLSIPRTIIPNNPTIINGANCSFNSYWNGYDCDSIYGQLVFASVGPDCNTSKVSPVYVNFTPSAADTDVLTLGGNYAASNSPQRNPLWSATVQLNITYMVNYTNTTPVLAQYELQSAIDQEWLILQISLISSWCVQISVGGSIIQPYIKTVDGPQSLMNFSNNTCGANMIQSDSGYLEVYITGEAYCIIDVQFVTGAYLITSLALNLTNFTQTVGTANLTNILAQTLNINSSRITIYSYTSGSTVVEYVIFANTSLSPSSQLSELYTVTQALINASNSGSLQVGGKPVLYNSFMISSSDSSGVQVINSTVVVPTNTSNNSSNSTNNTNNNNGGQTDGGSTFFQAYGALIILLAIFLLIGIFVFVYYWYKRRSALKIRSESEGGFDVEVVKPKGTKNDSVTNIPL